jgi:alpha-glucosidase
MLNGEIGKYVTIARKQRGSEDWFVGGITDETGRDLTLPLAFLSKERPYVAEVYGDAGDANWKTNPFGYKIEKKLVTNSSSLQLHLAPGGGVAMHLKPATHEQEQALKSGN